MVKQIKPRIESQYLATGDRAWVPLPFQPRPRPAGRLLALPELPGRRPDHQLALGVGHAHLVDVVEATDVALLSALLCAGAPGARIPGVVARRTTV